MEKQNVLGLAAQGPSLRLIFVLYQMSKNGSEEEMLRALGFCHCGKSGGNEQQECNREHEGIHHQHCSGLGERLLVVVVGGGAPFPSAMTPERHSVAML